MKDHDPSSDQATPDADRALETRGILSAAEQRDDRADARDSVADDRDEAASLESFLHDEDDGSAGLKARRFAGMDRQDAKADRSAAADDRIRLARPTATETHRPDPRPARPPGAPVKE